MIGIIPKHNPTTPLVLFTEGFLFAIEMATIPRTIAASPARSAKRLRIPDTPSISRLRLLYASTTMKMASTIAEVAAMPVNKAAFEIPEPPPEGCPYP
jgi:hypothetical protein